MSINGFFIRKLRVAGEGLPHAEIPFEIGLNVLSGPSNTGKSFIFKCLDFMLGSEKVPKQIDESKGYTTVFLELCDFSRGNIWTLKRSLQGGNFHLFEGQIDGFNDRTEVHTLLSRHNAKNKNNISHFLMGLSGIPDAKILAKKSGATQNLSFRSISHLFLVSETSIIAESSPVLSPGGYSETASKWLLEFLLTGSDGSHIIPSPDKKISKAKYEARLEVFDSLISSLEKTLKGLEDVEDFWTNQVKGLDHKIDDLTSVISAYSEDVSIVSNQRHLAWDTYQEAESRLLVIDELSKRFELLHQHYQSDLERLDFISEGDHLLSQLEDTNCPLCGSLVEAHSKARICNDKKTIIDLQRASLKEAEKIKTHIEDLKKTIASLTEEKAEVVLISQKNKQLVEDAERDLYERLQPIVAANKAELDQFIEARQILSKIDDDKKRLSEYRASKQEIMNQGYEVEAAEIPTSLNRSALRQLCDGIEIVLNEWRFPNTGVVEFDEKELDIIIGGKPRQNNGKGVRALAHAAFVVGLMNYSLANNRPHPHLVVLDSPLTTFREGQTRTKDDEVSGETQQAFFETLANTLALEQQIIIFENKIPPLQVRNLINYIEFVDKDEDGRKGFFSTEPELPSLTI